MVDYAVVLGSAFGVVFVLALLTHRSAERRRTNPVTSRILRLSQRHRGGSGLIVEVLWPVGPRGMATVGSVAAVERRRFRRVTGIFLRSPVSRHSPFWVPMEAGAHRLVVSDWQGRARHEHELVVDLDADEHVLVTCWPAKRGFVTPARPATGWRVQSLGVRSGTAPQR